MKVSTDACLFGAWMAEKISASASTRMLDIGAGTGLLSLQVAQQNDGEIDAIEIDENAATQSAENIANASFQCYINVVLGNVLEHCSIAKYDVIFSNPPFYEHHLLSPNAKKNTAHHSLELSLESLLVYIQNNLLRRGCFFLLLPFSRQNEVHDLIKKLNFFIHEIAYLRHSTLHPINRVFIQLSPTPMQSFFESDLCIYQPNSTIYTEEAFRLLQPYYQSL